MSYCRFSECDVYAYDSSDGGVQFYVSSGRRDLDRLCATYNEAYQYAKALRDEHGLDVPSHAIEALKADALEEAALICGPDSAVADLERENAKLRELAKLTVFIIETMESVTSWRFEGDGKVIDSAYLWDKLRELGIEVDK